MTQPPPEILCEEFFAVILSSPGGREGVARHCPADGPALCQTIPNAQLYGSLLERCGCKWRVVRVRCRLELLEYPAELPSGGDGLERAAEDFPWPAPADEPGRRRPKGKRPRKRNPDAGKTPGATQGEPGGVG